MDGGRVGVAFLVGDGFFEFGDAGDYPWVGIEEGGAGLAGGIELPRLAFQLLVLPGELGSLGLDRLVPGDVGLGGGDGAGLFGPSGSTSSDQPEVRVLGSLEVVVVTAPGGFESLVGVAD